MNEVWIVKSVITDGYSYESATIGDVEYQFSDGPPGERSMSSDYIDLEQGLADHSGYIIHWSN